MNKREQRPSQSEVSAKGKEGFDPWIVSLFVVACFLYRATAGQQRFHVSQFRRAESLFLFHLFELVLVSLGFVVVAVEY